MHQFGAIHLPLYKLDINCCNICAMSCSCRRPELYNYQSTGRSLVSVITQHSERVRRVSRQQHVQLERLVLGYVSSFGTREEGLDNETIQALLKHAQNIFSEHYVCLYAILTFLLILKINGLEKLRGR